jgi:hypothetical protein
MIDRRREVAATGGGRQLVPRGGVLPLWRSRRARGAPLPNESQCWRAAGRGYLFSVYWGEPGWRVARHSASQRKARKSMILW